MKFKQILEKEETPVSTEKDVPVAEVEDASVIEPSEVSENTEAIAKPEEVKDYDVFARLRDGLETDEWIYIIKQNDDWVAKKMINGSMQDMILPNSPDETNAKSVLCAVEKVLQAPDIQYIRTMEEPIIPDVPSSEKPTEKEEPEMISDYTSYV